PEADPKSAITPGQWRCPSSAARHHPAQKCRLAIGAHPVSRDMHQVRLRERPSALGTRQNCLDRSFLTHWVSSSCAKVALSLAQAASPAKCRYLGAKAITLRCRWIPFKLWIALEPLCAVLQCVASRIAESRVLQIDGARVNTQ